MARHPAFSRALNQGASHLGTRRCYRRPLQRFLALHTLRPSSGARLPGIEGVRAVAACSILLWHSWLYSSPSGTPVDRALLSHVVPDLQYGVILFFTLSGFLLYRPFAAVVLRNEHQLGFSRYLRNRALRILPAYWFVLLVAAAAFDGLLVRRHGELVAGSFHNGQDVARTATLTQNYSPKTVGTGLAPAWSLAVEVVFYLVLPVLAFGAWALAKRAHSRRGRRIAALAPAVILLCVGWSGKAVAARVFPGAPAQWGATWHTVVELSFWGMADLFSFGMILAVLFVEVEDRVLRLPRGWRPATAFAAVALYVAVSVGTANEQLSYLPSNTVVALAATLALAAVTLPTAARERRTRVQRCLESAPFFAVGTISYSIFLWQVPLIFWLRAHHLVLGGRGGLIVNTLLLFTLTLVLSLATYLFIEAPALRMKARRARSDAPTAPLPAA
jgi:peptidoglycan/LPS O-acetylase OafA/YrhL